MNNEELKQWARLVMKNHPDIIEHMLKSPNIIDRVIAKRIKILSEIKEKES
jgi:hypothetical protein